jgi:hypothetical protein
MKSAPMPSCGGFKIVFVKQGQGKTLSSNNVYSEYMSSRGRPLIQSIGESAKDEWRQQFPRELREAEFRLQYQLYQVLVPLKLGNANGILTSLAEMYGKSGC